MNATVYSRIGAGVLLLAALAALGAAIYNYVTPLTGVTGSWGALIAIGATAALSLGGLILLFLPSGVLRGILAVLIVLGIVGTFTAAFFLHEWAVMAAMVVALCGIFLDLMVAAHRAPARDDASGRPTTKHRSAAAA